MTANAHLLAVVLALPAHSRLPSVLSYSHTQPLAAGTLVRVPLGQRLALGIVWDGSPEPATPGIQIKPIESVLDALAPLNRTWRQLLHFSARYYQRNVGELALAALPPQLKDWNDKQLSGKLQRLERAASKDSNTSRSASTALPCNAEQGVALAAIHSASRSPASRPMVLFGRTGSGKTEVYLQAAADCLANDSSSQVLVLVPEINLTPQLQTQFSQRFAALGSQAVVSMHSGMSVAERSSAWILAHQGKARIVLGTRLAVFASLPNLRLIVVDEEHDPSYKAQDGARHSARDLALYRGMIESQRLLQSQIEASCPVVLGSATPSLEVWQKVQDGRYQRLDLPQRIGHGQTAQVRLVDMRLQPPGTVISSYLLEAIQQRIARGEQSLLLLNRRGYAPVLSCDSCGWKSACPHCSAFAVFHKSDRSLRCHHCGDARPVPTACPECGNLDMAPMGRGTEKLEEEIELLLAPMQRPDGQPVRVLRMDADSIKNRAALEQHLAQVHDGSVDVLVGTQMVAKGHDFRRMTLVAAINPDGGLFAADFRAPERTAALLMQAAGRAGRDASISQHGQMLVQTYNPEHPLFSWLMKQDWAGFADAQLAERAMAGMPPYSHQALLRAEARQLSTALEFLQQALQLAEQLPFSQQLTLYAPVPMPMQRIANVERAQLLLESDDRSALQQFLPLWRAQFAQLRLPGLLRWALDVDPAAI